MVGNSKVYIFSYFKTKSENLHLAKSVDAITWIPINNGKSILESMVGTQKIRDPFIRRGADGLFHLVWTDGWKSQFIGHSKSSNLVDWGEQELIPVMKAFKDAQNSWAPEFVYNIDVNLYYLFWSSTIAPAKRFIRRSFKRDHRIWYCTTPNFRDFSESRVFFDPGYNVIDSTIEKYQGEWYMAFKDERGKNRRTTPYKAIKIAKAEKLEGPWTIVTSNYVSPHLTEGPAFFQKDCEWFLVFDHFHKGHYSAIKTKDMIHWEKVSKNITFPEGVRHGTIFEVQRNKLMEIINLW